MNSLPLGGTDGVMVPRGQQLGQGAGTGTRSQEATVGDTGLVFQANGTDLNQGRQRGLEKRKWIPQYS